MGAAFFLRGGVVPNHFRDLVLRAVDGGFTRYLLTSGYFSESAYAGKFKSSGQLTPSSQTLASALNGRELKCVGVQDPGGAGWPSIHFQQFLANLGTAGVNVTYAQPIAVNWHAKVFVADDDLMLMGSSNLTSKAFGISDFNFEADLLIWNSKHAKASDIASQILSARQVLNPAAGIDAERSPLITGLDLGDVAQEKNQGFDEPTFIRGVRSQIEHSVGGHWSKP